MCEFVQHQVVAATLSSTAGQHIRPRKDNGPAIPRLALACGLAFDDDTRSRHGFSRCHVDIWVDQDREHVIEVLLLESKNEDRELRRNGDLDFLRDG